MVPVRLNMSVVVTFLAVGTAGLASDTAWVGIRKCPVFGSEELKEERIAIEAGVEVSIIKCTAAAAKIETVKGERGWVLRCSLCSHDEYVRRDKAKEIPDRVICVGAEKDGQTFLYGGRIPINNGSLSFEEGQGLWMDESAKARTFKVASHELYGDPQLLYLYMVGNRIASLKIWVADTRKSELPPSHAPTAEAIPEPEPIAVANLANAGDTIVVRTRQGAIMGTVISATTASICFQGAGTYYDTDTMTNIISYSVIARAKTVLAERTPPEGNQVVAVGQLPLAQRDSAENGRIQRQSISVSDIGKRSLPVQKSRQPANQAAKQREDYYRAKAKLRSEGYEIVNDASYRKMIASGNIPTAINVKSGNVFKCVSVDDYLKMSCPAPAAASKGQSEAVSAESSVVLINNNPYTLKVTLVNGTFKNVVEVPARGSTTAKTQPGHHDLFMVSSVEPEAEYQGDSFTVAKGAALTVTFNAASGNYSLRRVK